MANEGVDNGETAAARVGAAYLRLTSELVVRTVVIEPGSILVDVDAEGRAVGIETLGGVFDLTVASKIIRAAHFGGDAQ